MPIGMTEPEGLVEDGNAVAEMPVDLAAEVVLGMERLGDGTESHGLAGGLQAEQPVHRRRPVHMAAREVPAPDAAAGQRFGQLFGEGIFVLAPGRGGEIPEAAREQCEHEAGAD